VLTLCILLSAALLGDVFEVLRTSNDRDALERAAIEVVRSGDRADVSRLGDFLGDESFLARLDDVTQPQIKMHRLREIFQEITKHPSPEIEALCLRLGGSPQFLSDPDRKTLLMPALAAVRPMSVETAAFFRAANTQGYFSINAPLLAANGSERSLKLLQQMIADRTVPPVRRIDALHYAIVPVRTDPSVLAMAERLLAAALEPAVESGLVEALFDYRPGEWYEFARTHPKPPAWTAASPDARVRLLRLADASLRKPGLPANVAEAVRHSRDMIHRTLAQQPERSK
jgi:hypothetical protein